MKKLIRAAGILFACALGTVTTAASAEVVFTADGIPGTTLLAKPPAPNSIEALSFAFVAGGKASDLVITRQVDRASAPLLMASTNPQQRFKNVTVYLVNRAPPYGALYKVTLADASVASVKHTASDKDNVIQEQVTFEFAKAEIELFAQDKTGAVTPAGRASVPGRRP